MDRDEIPYTPWRPDDGPEDAARTFADRLATRRSVRMFSDRPVGLETMRHLVRAASSAPSGANKQPWRFVCVSDPDLKRRIREAAEAEERAFYGGRAPQRWLDDLRPFGTSPDKGFLEVAPWLVAVFALTRDDEGGQTYYVPESVGIAVGFFLAAVHHAGLCALTHTPSPMRFLKEVLGRPDHERPYLLIPVGWPADGCTVPDIGRKPLGEVMVVHGAGGIVREGEGG